MPRVAFYDPNSTESQPFYAMFLTYQGNYADDQSGRRANLRNKILSKIQDLSGMMVQDNISHTGNYYGQTIIEDSIPSYPPLITEHYVRKLPSNRPFTNGDERGKLCYLRLSMAESKLNHTQVWNPVIILGKMRGNTWTVGSANSTSGLPEFDYGHPGFGLTLATVPSLFQILA